MLPAGVTFGTDAAAAGAAAGAAGFVSAGFAASAGLAAAAGAVVAWAGAAAGAAGATVGLASSAGFAASAGLAGAVVAAGAAACGAHATNASSALNSTAVQTVRLRPDRRRSRLPECGVRSSLRPSMWLPLHRAAAGSLGGVRSAGIVAGGSPRQSGLSRWRCRQVWGNQGTAVWLLLVWSGNGRVGGALGGRAGCAAPNPPPGTHGVRDDADPGSEYVEAEGRQHDRQSRERHQPPR